MMDRALKERILGLVVLVIAGVLIVPVFLDGPPGDAEIVSERLSLPGQSGQESQTIVLNRDRTDPVPAANNNDKAGSAPAAQSGVSTSQEEKPVVVPAAARQQPSATAAQSRPAAGQPAQATTRSETGMWAVQLGSFSEQQNAERLAAELRKQDFVVFLSKLTTDSGQLHRVRTGPQKDRASAEAVAEKLGKAGYKGQVLPHP